MILRFERVNEEEAGDDGASDDQLDHENAVDLPHEVPPDGLIGEPFQLQPSAGLGIILPSSYGGSGGRGERARIWRRGRQWLHLGGLRSFVSHLTVSGSCLVYSDLPVL